MTFRVDSRIVRHGHQKPPSILRVAKNAVTAVVRNAAHVARGNTLEVSVEEKERRFGICKGCQYFRESSERCLHPACGCFLRAKTWLRAERCPVQKW